MSFDRLLLGSENGHEVAECPLMPESEADINWKFLKELLQSFDEEKLKEIVMMDQMTPSLSKYCLRKDNRNQRNQILPSGIVKLVVQQDEEKRRQVWERHSMYGSK
ncbi:hypothetical protein L1049_008214 [Liquidambar formosana]|uniref:Uncharacterized protein n=1 Tax=Liquidambar formosana TaxID=63359 RepID=A0AAP0X907_LIQFO